MMHTLAIGMPGLAEWIIIAALGLLFFGKRLPEVGRGLGRGILEFKKGLKGVEDDVPASIEAERSQPALTSGSQHAKALAGQNEADKAR